MQLKKLFFILALLGSMALPAQAQFSGGTAYRIISGSSLPATCTAGPGVADVYVKTGGSPGIYYCSATNTWTLAAGGGGGTGDVVGPASATDNAVVRFDLTTGKLVQNSVVLIGDTGNITGAGTLNTHTIPGGTDTLALLNATQTLANKTFTTPNLGTPSAAVLTNATGLPLTSGVTGTLPVANGGTNLTAATDDNVMVGNGTTWQAKAIPLCTDTGGNHLNYDTATNTFTCGTSSSGGGGGSGANPTASVGLTAVNGVATTFMRSDAAPPLDQGITPTWTGQHIWSLSNAAALAIGPNGNTNPVFRVVTNVASSATGLSITGNAAGSGVRLDALSSGASEGIQVYGKGSGSVISLGSGSTIILNVSANGNIGVITRDVGYYGWASGSLSASSLTADTALGRHAAGVVRVNNGSTGAGGLLIGTSSGTGVAGALVIEDVILRRNAAATLAFGAADAASPVAQTLSVQNATGTDIAGANWTLAASRGTGTGPGGSIIFQTASPGSTGSSQNALSTGLSIAGDAARTVSGNGWSIAFDTGASTGANFSAPSAVFYASSVNNRFSFGSGIALGWTSAAPGGSLDLTLRRHAASVLRLGDNSTGAGSLIIGTSAGAIGTSGVGVLAFSGSTAPSTSTTDTVQVYSGDAAAADHNLYARNEAGQINRLTGLAVRNSAQFDVTSSTTLATITGLTENVEAGRTYAFRAYVQTSAGAGGVKFAVGGTATATAISYEGELTSASDDNVVLIDRATALGTTVCDSSTTTTGTCKIEGVIQVNAAGTLVIQFAQSASNGTASSVLANQYLQLIPIS